MQALRIFKQCGPLFQALGDPQRQNIIVLLAESEPMTVGALAEGMHLSQPAVSHHLKILRSAKLVTVRHKGTARYYSLSLMDGSVKLKKLVTAIEIKHKGK